ncbi:hypothetical protein POM88_020368 [Heracleum sosnowskyi]|uniref:Uncharacterized protein n=1 Tax=Heracleum sosnowskyi TaxID=360622 RepID=A0AAD8IDY9_9APIA|nr:hypothetical protein POM88_020368 [Heracleum sosnowskyi]
MLDDMLGRKLLICLCFSCNTSSRVVWFILHDIYYRKAKEEGWCARSAFKLLQIAITTIPRLSHISPNICYTIGFRGDMLHYKLRIGATVGYLGASHDVPSLVDKLLHQLASKHTIVVNVYDTTNKAAPINMYGANSILTGLLHISTLDFGDPTRKH